MDTDQTIAPVDTNDTGSSGTDIGTNSGSSGTDTGTNSGSSGTDTGTNSGSSGTDIGTNSGSSGTDTGTSSGSSGTDIGTNSGSSGIDTGTNSGSSGTDTGTNSGSSGIDTAILTTIDELLGIHQALQTKQDADKSSLLAIFQPDDPTLKSSLVQWAILGFPSNYVLSSIQINPPPACLDGQVRNFFYYSLYLLDITDMSVLTSALDTRVAGMSFNFTLTDVNTLNLIVSKRS
jgi:hypothetical protein